MKQLKFGTRDYPTQKATKPSRDREFTAAREACEKDVCYYPKCSCFTRRDPEIEQLLK